MITHEKMGLNYEHHARTASVVDGVREGGDFRLTGYVLSIARFRLKQTHLVVRNHQPL